ncbi:MAG: DNA repair exonuclease [Nanoarchaeota archaeon]
MKFAHLGDCHLGSWRIPSLQQLNLESFRKAIDICISEKVDFVLIAGDLFDSAYPPIETLKEAFFELKRLKDSKIPCFLIAGSHDFSASGKTFLDVLERAGFCKNVYSSEEREDSLILSPTLHESVAIYGYPGKKAGMEVSELRKVKLQTAPGFFKIFMLHTSIKGAVGSLPIDSISESELPEADYYALGHLHIDYTDGKFVYSGPIFPNNFQELEELKYGSFFIVEVNNNQMSYNKINLKLKEVEVIDLEIKNALTATETILFELGKRNLQDKIVMLKLSGNLEEGKVGNINFKLIEEKTISQNAFTFIRSISKLSMEETHLEIQVSEMEQVEEVILKEIIEKNPGQFIKFVNPLINSLSLEKQEDEKSAVFEERLFSEVNKILDIK